jgi:hypothetical protein
LGRNVNRYPTENKNGKKKRNQQKTNNQIQNQNRTETETENRDLKLKKKKGHHLEDVECAEVIETSLLRIVHLSPSSEKTIQWPILPRAISRKKKNKKNKQKKNKTSLHPHPFMMTVWAGRLTPQAKVAVQTRTLS